MPRPRITCLPDVFVDVIVLPLKSYSAFLEDIDAIVSRGGGVYHQSQQCFSQGGGSGNVAAVLGALGFQPFLITKASPFGKLVIEYLLKPHGVQTFITDSGNTATTLAFEFETRERISNVMISSNLETLSQFGPAQLVSSQWDILSESDIIVVTNYAVNESYLSLVRSIADRVPVSVMMFLDFSDIHHRQDRLDEVHDTIEYISPRSLSVSLNEAEVALLNGRTRGQCDPLDGGVSISLMHPSTIFCVHTGDWSAEICGGDLVQVPSLPIRARRATGAGDTWNAGYLALLGDEREFRLLFANACAAYRMVTGGIPTFPALRAFLGKIEETIVR
jgi:sugar/nucleoside kinase (ribokinase family)